MVGTVFALSPCGGFRPANPETQIDPLAPYFTDIEPSGRNLRTLYKKLRVPKIKQEYVFWFSGRDGLSQLNAGRGRDRRIFFSAVDYDVVQSCQRHGDVTHILLGVFP